MTRFTPLWQQAGSYAAAVDRNLMANLYAAGGATGAPPVAVTNTMNVSIPPGRAAVPLQAGANTALCAWDAAEVVTSTAAPPAGNTRIDVVILQVRDPQLDAGVNNDFVFQVLAGAPTAGTPVAPAVPANALAVCQYTVPAAVANLNGVTIIDRRGATGPPPVFATVAARDAAFPSPTRGQLAVTADTDNVWQAVGAPPAFQYLRPGQTDFRVLTPQTGITSGIIGNSGYNAFPLAHRLYAVQASVNIFKSGTPTADVTLTLYADGNSTQLDIATNTITFPGRAHFSLYGTIVGSHTPGVMQILVASGVADVVAGSLWVTDIGNAP
jgi:hypothetical protein